MTKVKISGGGRCNVTHHCMDPQLLASHYPRGSRELRAAFYTWQPQDTIEWFAAHGVELKTEADGRMFPTTDRSQTIIDCFHQSMRAHGITLKTECALQSLRKVNGDGFELAFSNADRARAEKVCLAAGSLKSSALTQTLEMLGHTIEPLAPSLFAFNIKDPALHALAGLSVQNACVRTLPKSKIQSGPLLITHRGLSGPAILRLSAWEARALQTAHYTLEISINWLGDGSEHTIRGQFARLRKTSGRSFVRTKVLDPIPRRLWEYLVARAGIHRETIWSQLAKPQETALIKEIIDGRYPVSGKTTNKDEFVTCGGVRRKDIDWRRMESKIVPGLHFAGECIDYDGITGGFNFQGAWTTGHIAGVAMGAS